MNFDAGVDRTAYQGAYPYSSENPAYAVLLNSDASLGVRWNAGARVSRQVAGRQTLTAGGVFYDNRRQNQWFSYNDPDVPGANLLIRRSRAASTFKTRSASGPG